MTLFRAAALDDWLREPGRCASTADFRLASGRAIPLRGPANRSCTIDEQFPEEQVAIGSQPAVPHEQFRAIGGNRFEHPAGLLYARKRARQAVELRALAVVVLDQVFERLDDRRNGALNVDRRQGRDYDRTDVFDADILRPRLKRSAKHSSAQKISQVGGINPASVGADDHGALAGTTRGGSRNDFDLSTRNFPGDDQVAALGDGLLFPGAPCLPRDAIEFVQLQPIDIQVPRRALRMLMPDRRRPVPDVDKNRANLLQFHRARRGQQSRHNANVSGTRFDPRFEMPIPKKAARAWCRSGRCVPRE